MKATLVRIALSLAQKKHFRLLNPFRDFWLFGIFKVLFFPLLIQSSISHVFKVSLKLALSYY